MAVAARTYAVRLRGRHAAEGYDFCATTHCQHIELQSINARLEQAAAATLGEMLWYEGKPAFTCYTRDCGGRTEDGAAVWNVPEPYLKSHQDPYCEAAKWRWEANPQQIVTALRQSQLRTPEKVERVDVVARTPSGRAQTLVLQGPGGSVRVSAGAFRFALGRAFGWNLVASDSYQIHWPVFEGTGSGHGVGLCQRGADQMGAAGKTYREILAFYFPGSTLGVSGRGLAWQRLRGERITLLTTLPARDGTVLTLAERELATAAARMHADAPRDVEVRVYPDLDSFRNATGEPGWVAARTDGRRVHLQPVAVLRSHGALESTVRHEMCHVVVESQVAAALPVWFREGLTEYLSERGAHAMRAPSGDTDAAVRQRDSAAEARRAYEQSAGRVAELVARYGEAVVLSWVRSGLPADVKDASNVQAQRNKK
ncbi:SpoIID/LytB domain [Candidatus Sulfopaludibacter sp. SbA3]|nr:SpoIID/LytB domain [Candidatus Sulfopaludibacter sp. SbA3]